MGVTYILRLPDAPARFNTCLGFHHGACSAFGVQFCTSPVGGQLSSPCICFGIHLIPVIGFGLRSVNERPRTTKLVVVVTGREG